MRCFSFPTERRRSVLNYPRWVLGQNSLYFPFSSRSCITGLGGQNDGLTERPQTSSYVSFARLSESSVVKPPQVVHRRRSLRGRVGTVGRLCVSSSSLVSSPSESRVGDPTVDDPYKSDKTMETGLLSLSVSHDFLYQPYDAMLGEVEKSTPWSPVRSRSLRRRPQCAPPLRLSPPQSPSRPIECVCMS